ncbi:hypothetical protein Slin14017_G114820 [Septoria linicola]|nr:hypothetical protein Slin14017_G114820 [Septoria linicola]
MSSENDDLLAGLLSVLNNKPSRDWQISGVSITPNALIAIITTFSKSALLLPVAECIAQMKWPYFQQQAHLAWHLQVFDDLSRGPLRSMKLPWRLNIHTRMASLGAVITILALAVEPFTQQVITYEGLDTKASNLSSSIITNSIFALDGSNEEHKINLQLERALLSGLLSEVDDELFGGYETQSRSFILNQIRGNKSTEPDWWPDTLGNFTKSQWNPNAGDRSTEPTEPDSQRRARSLLYSAHGGNMTRTMQDVATSLAKLVREGPYSQMIEGDAYLPILHIRVNWAWLIYPAALPLLTVVLLTLVMTQSRGSDRLAWKTLSLALLFHGLGGDHRSARETRSLRTMEALANNMSVTIAEDEEGENSLSVA